MKIAVLHNDVPAGAPPDEQDALLQAETISGVLSDLGHRSFNIPFSLDLPRVAEDLRALSPDLVFNVVETVGGQGRLIHLAPSLLDFLNIPYTGSRTDAMYLTSNKLAAKKLLRWERIKTPAWYTHEDVPPAGGLYIIKSVWEHASVGLSDDSVVRMADGGPMGEEISKRAGFLGGEAFAEAYIEGREFNLSLLGLGGSPEVLPPAEILFTDYPKDKLRIVGYSAKWDDGAFEYHHTPRSFRFPARDAGLLRRLQRLAKRCWALFELRGYARVDFRVDGHGVPWVLEVNANPCLAPDSGFVAAVTEAGLTYRDVIGRILEDAFRPKLGRRKTKGGAP